MIYAPVIIPTLCRYEHFKECLESLSLCEWADRTEVFIGLDYPSKDSHRHGYEQIKDYLSNVGNMKFKKIHVLKRNFNYGASRNVKDLRQYVQKFYDVYIYSEDDNVFSRNFLLYMDTCLERYKDDPNVIAVCGYSYPVNWDVSEQATVFKQQINCSTWGTGYWVAKSQRVREMICSGKMLSLLPNVIKNRKYLKMIDACLKEYIEAACSWFGYKTEMLQRCTDIGMRAYLAVFDKYAITPVISKVRNKGFDGSGLYCQKIDTEQSGDTAGTYKYSIQPIDKNENFDFVESVKLNADENRNKLNNFDFRSKRQMLKTHQLLWICINLGVPLARLYSFGLMPLDIVKRTIGKIRSYS